MKHTGKRWLALLLCAVLLAAGLPLSALAEAGSYEDVPEGAWYAPAVEYVSEAGLMNGVGGGRFDPKGEMSRAMFVQVLYNITEHPQLDPEEKDFFFGGEWWEFSDVNPISWCSQSTQWAYRSGITEGIGDNRFGPGLAVTREQMAQLLYRYAGATENETGFIAGASTSYNDFDKTSSGAQMAMDWAVTQGILQGDSLGRLRPKDTATRAEAAQLLCRAAPLLKNRVVRAFSRTGREAAEWGLTAENYPRVDGSTSTLSLVQGAFWRMHACWNEAAYPLAASRTVPSYEKLIAGDVDLILVPYASADVLAQAERAGVELEFHKLALEALVFITRADNPTENITEEQAVSIYRDNAIQNWKEVGGPDKELVPICRNANSGSQSQMDNLILKGQAMHPDIQNNYTELTMPGMLYQVAFYLHDDSYGKPQNCAALGYTLFAYLDNYGEDPTGALRNLKMLSYNGVAPTEESLKDGSYSLTDGYYAVLRKDTPQDAPARKLLSWYQSEEGAGMARSAGFLPAF